MLILVAGAILFMILAAVWLGWGKRSDWARATGWDRLGLEEHGHLARSAEAYQMEDGLPHIEWLGHASVMIEWEGIRMLIDPVGSPRITVAVRRFVSPNIDYNEIYGAILLTHAHMDHLDNATLVRLAPSRLILPMGSERFLSRQVHLRHRVEPVSPGSEKFFGSLRVVVVNALHGGWRYPWQRGLFACGYVLSLGASSIYIAGDSAYGPHFKEIGAEHRPSLAVLPIGAYSPKWFLQKRHLNPEQALTAAQDLGAKYVMPVHFGTYRLSTEPLQEPFLRFVGCSVRSDQASFLAVKNETSGALARSRASRTDQGE